MDTMSWTSHAKSQKEWNGDVSWLCWQRSLEYLGSDMMWVLIRLIDEVAVMFFPVT